MNFKVVDIAMVKSDNLGFTISGNVENYLRVSNVKENGIAEEAGLRNGDCILNINGFKIVNRDDIIDSLKHSMNSIKIRVLRKSDSPNIVESSTTSSNNAILRRRSIQEGGSLHRDFLQSMGSKIGTEVIRAYPGTLRPGDLIPKNVSQIKNLQKSSNVPMKKISDPFKTSETMMSTSSPIRASVYATKSFETKERPFVNLSMRKKSKLSNNCQTQSLSNISNFSKSYQNLSSTLDINYSSKSTINHTNSMTSLFDENCSNITEYKIDWEAIYSKVSTVTINDIEKELISYFTNSHTDLRLFPVNSMYRYITFNGVLNVVFNIILPADTEVDFQEEVSKIPSEIYDIDYDMNSYNIINLIKCNVKRINGQLREYNDRKNDLSLLKEKLKETLDQYLSNPQHSSKMHSQVDRIHRIFEDLSNFLISMVIAMSMWKFSKDFAHLYESKNFQTNILSTSETMLTEFRKSQKNLEKNIINLFRRFKEDNSQDVLNLFDKIFSETLDLSICIPLFCEKLKRDNEMLGHLENGSSRDSLNKSGRVQFV